MASKVDKNRDGLVEWLRDCGIPPELSASRIDLLVAAVRQEERMRAEMELARLARRQYDF